jgi:hypothetical protein
MVYITHVRLSTGGTRHEHITDLTWRNPQSGDAGGSTKATMVDWIKEQRWRRARAR